VSVYYLDTSAIVKRYLIEPGSSWIITLIEPAADNILVTGDITRVEVAAALAARHRAGTITVVERDGLVTLFLLHCDDEYQITAIDSFITSKAIALTQRHRLRGYDAVQLATALLVNQQLVTNTGAALTFVTADDDLIEAAQAEGLATENPNGHP
jgi:hypothetical protein